MISFGHERVAKKKKKFLLIGHLRLVGTVTYKYFQTVCFHRSPKQSKVYLKIRLNVIFT